jgi:CRP/FNR family cyclic AMP-dependent transcriptional regulator
MDKATFNYMLDNFSPVARNLVKILSSRVRFLDQLIQALATLDVNGRVARQLLAFAEKFGSEKDGETQIRLVLTQGDIADLVGASRKRVNQAMVLFKEQGLIDTEPGGRIAIRNGEGLARFCR